MQATAIAQTNIALIKYWGKRDVARNLPAVGSISITLRELYTEVSVELTGDTGTDLLVVNGTENTAMLPRISACLDNVIGRERQRALVTSASNFPIAAGLASSASAFAAVTVAAAAAAELDRSTDELSRLAGRASGSAARSLYGGFAELENTGDSISVRTLLDTEAWPLQVVVAITETGAKPTGSTEAMEISRQSSPFYSSWVQQQQHDLDVARSAILQRDFDELATIAEHNCLKMHSVMWASRPPMVYWNSATMRCMQTVRELQQQGHKVFFTIDAGPQLKAVCLPDEVDIVAEALAQTDGVREIMRSGLGAAARLIT
jgi:diphosphomevalonate decarboxylase